MKRLVILYLAVLSVLSVSSAVLLRCIWPDHYPSMLFIIPLFYAVMLGVMAMIKRWIENNGKDRSLFFLSYRVIKIILALVVLLAYFSLVGSQLLPFAIVFMAYYLCLSMVETVLFMKGEKKS